jgi:hypothetical protein
MYVKMDNTTVEKYVNLNQRPQGNVKVPSISLKVNRFQAVAQTLIWATAWLGLAMMCPCKGPGILGISLEWPDC